MKVMISQPMKGRTEEQIKEERKRIVDKFNKMHIEVINTIFTEEAPEDYNMAVYYLAKSIDVMRNIDALYMCDGWREARGCRIEHQVAKEYGIKILDSDFIEDKQVCHVENKSWEELSDYEKELMLDKIKKQPLQITQV
ncbi:MAG: DUF4406 domain-containing protein [Clostridia bacterium]|nr:DUF4406 domain-containing protein [Clostridia bacterium]